MPPDDANTVGGNGKWVKDTNRFLAKTPLSTSDLDCISSLALIDSPTCDSPLSTPSTSPASSVASSLSSNNSSKYSFIAPGNKSSYAKPMVSPASSIDSLDFFGPAGTTFLGKVFPTCEIGRTALPVNSKMLPGWSLALTENNGERTVYAKGARGSEAVCSTENVIALLDHADEELECDQVVVVLDKKDADLAQLLHSLLYIGGTVVSPAKSTHADDFVLVGLEL